MGFILFSCFFVLSILAILNLKVYQNISVSDLRIKAREKDKQSERFYKAAIYREGLDIFLRIITGLGMAGFISYLFSKLPIFIAFILVFLYILFLLLWLPNTKTTKLTKIIVEYLATPLSWLMRHIHKPFDFIGRKVDSSQVKSQISLFDKKLSKEQIKIIESTLRFDDKKVSDVMTPKRMIKMVSSSDIVGPVLMGELHNSGFSRFPVYRDSKDTIVGTLNLKDLITKYDGQSVSSAMSNKIYFVNEDKTINHVLNAFYKTDNHIFVVVNNFEEVVGVITIEDILEQIIGKPIKDEFDKWEDLREVATLTAIKEHEAHKKEQKVVE